MVMLVGNKSDKNDDRCVSIEEGRRLAVVSDMTAERLSVCYSAFDLLVTKFSIFNFWGGGGQYLSCLMEVCQ